MTDEELMSYVSGRLYGLGGTVRYDIADELRLELKGLAQRLARQEPQQPETSD